MTDQELDRRIIELETEFTKRVRERRRRWKENGGGRLGRIGVSPDSELYRLREERDKRVEREERVKQEARKKRQRTILIVAGIIILMALGEFMDHLFALEH